MLEILYHFAGWQLDPQSSQLMKGPCSLLQPIPDKLNFDRVFCILLENYVIQNYHSEHQQTHFSY